MTQPVVKPKFKVGQKVRFKSLEELIRLGLINSIRVNYSFRHSSSLLTISKVNVSSFSSPSYQLSSYEGISEDNWWYPEAFLQPVRQLSAHLKGKL